MYHTHHCQLQEGCHQLPMISICPYLPKYITLKNCYYDYSVMIDPVHGVRELCLNSAQPSYGEHCTQTY